MRRISNLLCLLALMALLPISDALARARRDAARSPVQLSEAQWAVAAVLLSAQPPAQSWAATGGIGKTTITGATVVAGCVHQAADPIRYRAAIAANAPY